MAARGRVGRRALACAGWAFVFGAAALPARSAPLGSPAPAVAASNAFGFALYARVKGDDGNVICSPPSASIALTMAWAGARGATRDEMTRVLALGPGAPEAIHRSFGALLHVLDDRDRDTVTIHLADRLWGQQGLDFRPEFLQLLGERYGAPLERVDFLRATEQARVAINRWAATETKGLIPEVLGSGDLDASTRLVLTNAIYLKAAWAVPFRQEATSDDSFVTAAGKITTRTMHEGEVSLKYAHVRDAQLVELDYQGDLSMVVVLPDAVNGLAAIEAQISARYRSWLKALRFQVIELTMPRWTVRSRLSLSDALAAMGMPAAFGRTANFSGMATPRPLFIQKVLQEAFVRVDEQGTEAAAVTAVTMGTIGVGRSAVRPIPFHADHPFLYLIRDKQTGAILFIGRVVDPR